MMRNSASTSSIRRCAALRLRTGLRSLMGPEYIRGTMNSGETSFGGRTVLVTGAAGNLGRAVAAAFAARGANLALLDRKEEQLRQAFGAESAQRLFLEANLLEQPSVDAAVARAVVRFKRIDALCNLAGGFRMGEAVH